MSAPYIIPFNFQPVNTVVGTSGSYTVPSGKYAIVTISLTVGMKIGFSGSTSSIISSFGVNYNGGSRDAQIYLKAGDILSFSSTAGTGVSVTTAGGSINASMMLSTDATSLCLVNSVVISEARSTISGYYGVQGFAANSAMGISVTTVVGSGYIASEYNVIS